MCKTKTLIWNRIWKVVATFVGSIEVVRRNEGSRRRSRIRVAAPNSYGTRIFETW